jgi:hypothetical protein
MEKWKWIEGYKNRYKISTYGNVKSFVGKSIKTMKHSPNSKGYGFVELCYNGGSVTKAVHRLVAETFLKRDNKYLQVNHKDGNKLNNNINNLEWVTARENIIHSYKNNLKKNIWRPQGIKHPKAKLTDNQVISIRKEYNNNREYLSKKYGVSLASISLIINERTWKHLL